MPYLDIKPYGKITRRDPNDEGDPGEVVERENLISRDKKLVKPGGTTRALSSVLAGKVTWLARYNSLETGVTALKTFAYTQDGKIYFVDESAHTATEVKSNLNLTGYPKHTLFKTQTQTKMYMVDGQKLYRYDGNNDNRFDNVGVVDSNGDDVLPIDVIEHKDRLCLLSKAYLFISKNLEPDVFDDATDSLQIIVGSGKGQNLAFGRLEDKLYIFNTEGIFVLYGDVISAVASTFEVRLLEERRCIAGRSVVKVEKALIFLADDYNIWSWDGSTSQKLSHVEKLDDFVNTYRSQLDKAVASYYNNFYMLSFVEKGETVNKLEVWWDAFESKIDFVRGRNVSCYMQTDPNIEQKYMLLGRSDINMIMLADDNYNFDGEPIAIRLRTKDISPQPGRNVRFVAFYPKISPTGERNITIQYMLDGRLSNLTGSPQATQSIQGEYKTLGFIQIKNQSQFTDRIRPKILYSKGTSISFLIIDSTLDMTFELRSIRIEFVDKFDKKGKKVSQ